MHGKADELLAARKQREEVGRCIEIWNADVYPWYFEGVFFGVVIVKDLFKIAYIWKSLCQTVRKLVKSSPILHRPLIPSL